MPGQMMQVQPGSLHTSLNSSNEQQMEDVSNQPRTEVWQNAQQQIRPMINFSDNMIRDARFNN